MSQTDLSPAGGLVQQRPFVLFWLARIAATIGYQMMALVIGWKIYEITGSAFDLGLVIRDGAIRHPQRSEVLNAAAI